eukprot:1902583-Prymnesium_polylepis.2
MLDGAVDEHPQDYSLQEALKEALAKQAEGAPPRGARTGRVRGERERERERESLLIGRLIFARAHGDCVHTTRPHDGSQVG